jgi:hypothetical protein
VRLICGDHFELLYAKCEEGSNSDSFLEYAYGRRVLRINATQGRDTQKLDGEDEAGWFPFDLVRPVLTPTPSLPPSIGECTTDGMPIRFTLVNPGAAYTTEKRPSDYHCGMLSFELCLPPELRSNRVISPFFNRVISIAPRLVLRVSGVCDPCCELQR